MKTNHNRTRSIALVNTDDSFLSSTKLVVVMCGLPARGKSYISQKIRRYLNWMGVSAKDFNVGTHRRKTLTYPQNHTFFSQENAENTNIRNKLAMEVLEELILWLKNGGHVGIHDATNTTRLRRELILQRISQEKNIEVLFIESILTEDDIIEKNIELKLYSPDYQGQDRNTALEDFKKRLKSYESVYEPLDEKYDSEKTYIKLINIGKRVETNNIHGYLPSQMVFFLMNYHISKRKIWLTRHGESLDNIEGRIGGDSNISSNGIKYSMCLRDFFLKNSSKLKIWTSCLKRSIQTSAPIYEALKQNGKLTKLSRLHSLNEIYAGTCEGMTYKEIEETYPEEYEMRTLNKMRYRYPGGGESYLDLIERLKPLIIELERETSDVLIITHNAVVRTIIGYFTDIPAESLPHIEIPLNHLICLTPTPFGCDKEVIDFTKEIEESIH